MIYYLVRKETYFLSSTLMFLIHIFRLAHLVWEPSVLVAVSVCHLSAVCLSVPRHISETTRDMHEILPSL